MESLISRPKAKPMRYAGWLLFLEKLIFVPNQSNQARRLRLLISTTLLIIAVAVIILFYHDDLREAKRIQGPLDSPVRFCCNFSDPVDSYKPFTETESRTQVDERQEAGKVKPISWMARPHFHSGRRGSTPAQVSPPSPTNHQISLPEQNTGTGEFNMPNVLGPNQSDPVWQLRLLAAFSLVVHATMGVLILPGDLQGVNSTYRRVMLITSFGVPIVVAVITLLVSFWLVPDPSGQSNWITGLSVANFSLLGGRLAVYWMLKRGTENILRGEAS